MLILRNAEYDPLAKWSTSLIAESYIHLIFLTVERPTSVMTISSLLPPGPGSAVEVSHLFVSLVEEELTELKRTALNNKEIKI